MDKTINYYLPDLNEEMIKELYLGLNAMGIYELHIDMKKKKCQIKFKTETLKKSDFEFFFDQHQIQNFYLSSSRL